MQPDQKLNLYSEILEDWQKTINLVSRTTLDNLWVRHFQDSLQLLKFIPDNAVTIVDIGSGGGFPGLVLAIKRPDCQFHLIESDIRKCAFLKTVSRETFSENVTVVNNRIEDAITDMKADIITSRALGSLKYLLEVTNPVWMRNKNLMLILLKGANYQSEVDEAENAFNFKIETFDSETHSEAKRLIVSNIASFHG